MKAPFPYFGGKRRSAAMLWEAFGDPGGYVEPFCGSAAVLLNRPAHNGRRVETLNDADGWLVNAWRSIQLSPAAVAKHCAGPVTEIDYHARLAWLQERRGEDLVSWLEGDPEAHDPKAAGWWLYVLSCGIGDPFGKGPWSVVDGRLVKTGNGVRRKIPHLGDSGKGINRELPFLSCAERGVNRTMPGGDSHEEQIAAELSRLARRLERVRITCGDWRRVLTPVVASAKLGGDGSIAILLDPPYSTGGYLYAEGCATGAVSADVREWCKTAPPAWRIALCGYGDEHDEMLEHGWRVAKTKAGGSGYKQVSDADSLERVWLSPACLAAEQAALWTEAVAEKLARR